VIDVQREDKDVSPVAAQHTNGQRGIAFRVSGIWYFQDKAGGVPRRVDLDDFTVGVSHLSGLTPLWEKEKEMGTEMDKLDKIARTNRAIGILMCVEFILENTSCSLEMRELATTLLFMSRRIGDKDAKHIEEAGSHDEGGCP
jgi:hypothetical protein